MAKAPEFPNPVKMRGRLFWRRSELETYKHQLLTFASGVPASAGFVANQIESFVPAGEVALEFGFGRRTLGRRIAGRNIPEVA